MPEISRFFGMVIALYYNDHAPPHFHVRYGKQKAVIGIDPLVLLAGKLSPRASALVLEWAAAPPGRVADRLGTGASTAPLNKIDPLE